MGQRVHGVEPQRAANLDGGRARISASALAHAPNPNARMLLTTEAVFEFVKYENTIEECDEAWEQLASQAAEDAEKRVMTHYEEVVWDVHPDNPNRLLSEQEFNSKLQNAMQMFAREFPRQPEANALLNN